MYGIVLTVVEEEKGLPHQNRNPNSLDSPIQVPVFLKALTKIIKQMHGWYSGQCRIAGAK